jgi:uncharacterized protein YjbI with pentapeptide repeats
MQKSISFIFVLFVSFTALPAFAEEGISPPASDCAEWRSSVNVDTEALDKLQRNSASDKPASGMTYTKNQFVILLGKNLAKAKDFLADSKDKLPKTSEGKVDLKEVTLNGFNLSGLNLDNVDLKGAELVGADLSGSSLSGASLAKADLTGANLNNVNLSYATLAKAKLNNASLCRATLTSVDFEGATMGGAYLRGAKFDMAKNLPKAVYLNSQNVLFFGLAVPAD